MEETSYLPRTDLTLHRARQKLAGWHFSQESLTDGEREILYVAEALLRQIDADADAPSGIPGSTGLVCPECGEPIWDRPSGSKLAKCWNTAGHTGGGTLAFDTMGDETC